MPIKVTLGSNPAKVIKASAVIRTGVPLEVADTYADISESMDRRFVYVVADETNVNDENEAQESFYFYTGTALKRLPLGDYLTA